MALGDRKLVLQLDIVICDGGFIENEQLLTYVKYRLNLQGRDKLALRLDKIEILSDELIGDKQGDFYENAV